MQVPVARFKCRHPGCAHLDPSQNNFSMSTIYEHIACHLQTDTGRTQQLNLRCSCSPKYSFVALSYATSHLNKFKAEIQKHEISTVPITLREIEVSQKIMCYMKRFCAFYKYLMEEDKEYDLKVHPIISLEETTSSQMGMPQMPPMPPQMHQQMYPPHMPQMMFNPYGMPTPGFPTMFAPGFPAPNHLGSVQEDIKPEGSRTPARTPVYGSPSPPRHNSSSGNLFQQQNDVSFQMNPRETSFNSQRGDRDASTSEFDDHRGGFRGADQPDRGLYRGDQGRGGYRGTDQRGRSSFRGGDNAGRGGYRGADNAGRGGYRGADNAGRGGYRGTDNVGGRGGYRNDNSMNTRKDDANPRQGNRRIRDGASPRSSDEDEPAAKRAPTAQFNSGATSDRQRDNSGSSNRFDERKPNPLFSASRLDTSSTARKDGASPRSDSDKEQPRNGGSNRKPSAPPRSQHVPRSHANERGGGGPSRSYDRNGGNARNFDPNPSASNRGAPVKKKKGMGDISDRSDSD